MLKPLYILGAGGFAREVANCLVRDINELNPTYEFMGYVERDSTNVGKSIGRHKIVCAQDELQNKDVSVVIAIGNPKIIESLAAELKQFTNLEYPNLIHPRVRIGDTIAIGRGNIICEGNILTTDITIGSFNIINLGSTIGHDSKIGSHCVINPGCHISGGVTIGDSCMIGTGAIILEKRELESKVIVGGGAVVVKKVTTGQTVVGVPAKPL